MKRVISILLFFMGSAVLLPSALLASSGEKAAAVNVSVYWSLPFVGILLCIAVIPLINAHFWEKNLWWISLGVFCLPMAVIFGFFMGDVLREKTLEKCLEYLSFIMLLASLFVISGGILVKGKLSGTPVVNSVFLLIGSIIASFVGTTGASMLLIRPLIRANKNRRKKAHIVIFFIFLVSNIGGVLTPLGDPPLFLGYLQGVPFEWTFRLFPQWIFTSTVVLIIFFIMDNIMYKKEQAMPANEAAMDDTSEPDPGAIIASISRDLETAIGMLDVDRHVEKGSISLKLLVAVKKQLASAQIRLAELGAARRTGSAGIAIDGKINLIFLAGVVFIVFMQGYLLKRFAWWPHFGPQEGGMLLMLAFSLLLTPVKSELRVENGFTFQPIKEVALIFAGIFATMIPALYILELKGASLGIVKPWQFFWATGGLSSFLDNAPTYLTFVSVGKSLHLPNTLNFVFNDGGTLTTPILAAISCGAVFMGANTYIGNGPNFMVRSIAEEQGVKMPSFFGYMLYSCAVLIPTFVIVTFIFFR